jgi:uncharacterized protein DUF6931
VTNGSLVKVKARTAAEISAHMTLADGPRRLLKAGMGPREFVDALLARQEYVTAVDFIAHALPAREAVWWGSLCLQHAYGNALSQAERAAARAAVQWVLEPTEPYRAATKAPGDAAGSGSPAGLLAGAAHQTGGNLAPPKAPPVAPPPFAPAKAVAGAVKLAVTKGDPVRVTDTQRLYVELGIGVAEGRVVWPEIPAQPGGRR